MTDLNENASSMPEEQKSNIENRKDTLQALSAMIVNYDNKATALMTAVGVVFGFSLFSIQEFQNKSGLAQVTAYVFGTIYLIAFATSIVLLVLVVLPRSRSKKERLVKTDYPLYFKDVYCHVRTGDAQAFVDAGVSEFSLMDQIKVCSRIANTKERLLFAAVVSIVVFAASLVSLVVCLVL